MILDLAKLTALPLLLVAAAASDLVTMTIPNRIALLIGALFFAVAAADGMSLYNVGQHVAAGAVVLAVTFIFFARGWMGGGDAKLAAVTALWLGFADLGAFALTASIFGGALTLFILLFRSWPLPFAGSMPAWALKLHDDKTGIPYGIALAAAALAIYPHTQWMKTVDLSRFIIG
jgi:prepilin peptidase CpaA